MQKAAKFLEENFHQYLDDLIGLARIPSVSFPQFPASELDRSAQAVASLLRNRGLENVEILKLEGAHPYIYGERMHAPGKPTLLLYAHHDVQPPGREEMWKTSPFEPTIAPGPGGDRLWGRGTADDKAGIVIHTSAIAAFLETAGELPLNVKLVVEGEEEIGSGHLPEFLRKYRQKLDADVLVLTDTMNFDCGIPGLTISLRGLVALGVEVRSLSKTVHSGMWGGPLPDPAMALTKMLSQLVDENGKIAVPGIVEQMKPFTPAELDEFRRIPFSEEKFREQGGVLPRTRLLREGVSPLIQTWRHPSLTVNAIQASSRKNAGNIINDSAWAKISIRLVPGMDPHRVTQQLRDFLESKVPWGLEMDCHLEAANGAWSTDPKGKAFEAAKIAMEKGYGVAPLLIGTGGSIPFVAPFAEALGGAPALLIGVEDPYTNAHGENESLLISDFRKACLSQVHLFSELAERFEPITSAVRAETT